MTATDNNSVQIIARTNEGDIQIGQTYTIRRQDGTLHEATIIQTRETDEKNREYYVHYSGLNRRLDQWVTVDQILSPNTVDDDENMSVDSNKPGLCIHLSIKCVFLLSFYEYILNSF